MDDSGIREVISFCRTCIAACGTRLKIDAQDRIVEVRGDKEQPLARGYLCFKGLQAEEAHHGPARILHPLKRQPDGSFERIGLEQALDEIAGKVRPYVEAGNPNAIATFIGNCGFVASSAFTMQRGFMAAIGSQAYYTTATIDSPNKMVVFERQGGWAAGSPTLEESEVALVFGSNPRISHFCNGLVTSDPTRRIRDAVRGGLKLIVVDPRETETAHYAALQLQPIPGQDAAIAGAMLRIVLAEGWYDRDFVERYTTPEGMAALRQAVEPFTESYAEERAGLPPGQIRAAAQMFARDCKRGAAFSGTGLGMAPYANVAQHLISALNIVCGRFRRAGDRLLVDLFAPEPKVHEGVIPPPRTFEKVPPGRIRGPGLLLGERLSGTLPDEILTPGEGQVRCLFVLGGNPGNSVPDTPRMMEAFEALDVSVAIEPYMTATARHCQYILPPTMAYERADLPTHAGGGSLYTVNWLQYAAPVIDPPRGSQVCEDWYPFWAIASRLGIAIDYDGKGPLPLDRKPTTDELLEIRLKGACVSLEELKKYPSGKLFAKDEWVVQPVRPEDTSRFDMMPTDALAELQEYLRTGGARDEIVSHGKRYGYLLSSRRIPDVMCSTGTELANTRRRCPTNPLFVNPDDMSDIGIVSGDMVRITSDYGSVVAFAEADDGMRPGVVSIAHGWGGEAQDGANEWDGIANVNLLIAGHRDYAQVSAMPRMSAIPVNVEFVRRT